MIEIDSTIESKHMIPVVKPEAATAPKPGKPKGKQITPFFVAVQCIEWMHANCLLGQSGRPPRRFLDPSAGTGIWCRAMRSIFPKIEIVAVEREREHEHDLKQVADHVIIDTFQPDRLRGQPFDVIATNPPFTGADQFVAGIFANRLLRPASDYFDEERNLRDLGGVLSFLHYLSFTSRSEHMEALVSTLPPTFQLNIPGHVIFVPNTRGDSRSYGHFIWTAKTTGQSWRVENLPRLPSQLRRHPTKHELEKLRQREAIEGARPQ